GERVRPRDRADEEARPERRERDDEQRDLVAQVLHLQGKEVRDRETEQETRDDRDQRRVEAAEHVVPVGGAVEDRRVVREGPFRREARLRAELVRPEADEDDEDERGDEEEAEPEAARKRPRGRRPAAAALARLRGAAERLLPRRLLELLGLLDAGQRGLRR